jgi:hypothetical protein
MKICLAAQKSLQVILMGGWIESTVMASLKLGELEPIDRA